VATNEAETMMRINTPYSSDTTALILCGGMGTRLQSVFSEGPKVLAPVNGIPFLSFLLKQFSQAFFKDVILCSGYKGNQIEATFGDCYEGVFLRYSQETEPLGTGGAIRNSMPLIKTDTILVMNGDSYIDINLTDYLGWFQQKNALAAMLLKHLNNTARFGRVEVNDNNRILSFSEKRVGLGKGFINAGVYILKRSVLEMIPEGEIYSLETQLLPSLVDKEFYGLLCDGNFIDIGTPESYDNANSFFVE
jgi:D-glycero-alpha-D-manno-heptose 1-phosphate guanylyltransferase